MYYFVPIICSELNIKLKTHTYLNTQAHKNPARKFIQNMKTSLSILFFLFLGISSLFSQSNFPADWSGEWAGTLHIIQAKGTVQELPMELHILPLDSTGRYTWTIIYGEDKVAGRRPYELLPLDPGKGLYAIDEKNSIRMEGYLLGGSFYQWFEVEGSLLLTTTALQGDELLWEIVAGSIEPVSVTGGETVEGEEVPPVKTFPITVVQRARLKKR